jgi:hypothetical protein
VDFLKLSNMSKVKKHKSEARCKTGKYVSHLFYFICFFQFQVEVDFDLVETLNHDLDLYYKLF